MNEQTRVLHELIRTVLARLEEAGGQWVPYGDLLALAPEGRRIVVPELEGEEPFSGDYAAGSAWDAGGTGQPDRGMLLDAINAVRAMVEPRRHLEEGHPQVGYALRITT